LLVVEDRSQQHLHLPPPQDHKDGKLQPRMKRRSTAAVAAASWLECLNAETNNNDNP